MCSSDLRRASSRSFTSRIAEVSDTGAVTEDRGFLWKLNSYWKFSEEEDGVFVECESLSLSRSIPLGMGWLIGPYIDSVPRESMENTLNSIRSGIARSVTNLKEARR